MLAPISNNISLENLRSSDYWKLVSIVVWNHYSEEKFQNDGDIDLKEVWYGKSIEGRSSNHSESWDSEDYSLDGYVRSLHAVRVILRRLDYCTYINILHTGDVTVFGKYNDHRSKSPSYSYSGLKVTNWMLENGFLKVNL